MGNEQMQAAMKELQDSMVILARIEKKQRVSRELAQLDSLSDKFRLRTEKNLAEITEKLNRLIGPQ
jgi:hypothetical protein